MSTMTDGSWTWEELAGRALARQFPVDSSVRATDVTVDQVTAWLEATGPIQSQTARSPFIGLAARFPGLTHAALTAAYESHAIVRGSVIRGTVHTSTPAANAVLDAVTRIGQRTLWQRTLKPEQVTLEQVWDSIEDFARDDWRTSEELLAHVSAWLGDHESTAAAGRLTNQAGRYFSFGHGGLVRRPLKGGWDGQGTAGYRSAATLLGSARPPLPSPDEAVDTAIRLHLRAHGPASRNDLAWWSGVGLTVIDAGLARLEDELTTATGPDGRTYVDLITAVPDPIDPASVGIRLLPEFDALLCGYDPKARDRFVTSEHHALLWNQRNGFMAAPLLRGGRLAGLWRFEGTGRTRDLTVSTFRGSGRLGRRALDDAIDALQRGLDISIRTVAIVAAR